ncbi:hypothetical protein SDC9_146382 [bioreactor metagenome]|uniref:Uncharacterized protein n=1 Tax=bioreactor metagenome TaxID=1076179 RepID=A0A645ECW6_9ZZZZ
MLFSAGQIAGVLFQQICQSAQPDNGTQLFVYYRSGEALSSEHFQKVFLYGAFHKKTLWVLRQYNQQPFIQPSALGKILTEAFYPSALRLVKAGHKAQQGGFARAVAAQHSHPLSGICF